MATFSSSRSHWDGGGGSGFRSNHGFPARGHGGGFHRDRPRNGNRCGGCPNGRHSGNDDLIPRVTVPKKTKDILGGDSFPECKSPSLRFNKYVLFHGKKVKDGKQREIAAAVKLHNDGDFRCPVFEPRGSVKPLVATLKSRLIVNQAGGILENAGISIHPHFGAPFLPGSAVKGIARHAAWLEWTKTPDDRKDGIAREIAETFGYPTGNAELDANLKRQQFKTRSGSVSFLAAVPCDEGGNPSQATLAVDIVTPHLNDWSEPVPNAFPVVEAGSRFRFALAPVGELGGDAHLKRARDWLAAGLVQNGIGAKTGAGYGAFAIAGVQAPPSRVYDLTLVSPAFLRGADVDSEGFLRVASLRGVLRYWWRIIFGSVLSPKELERLEMQVWGGMLPDANGKKHPLASRILLRLKEISSSTPKRYDKEMQTKHVHPELAGQQGSAWMKAGLPYVSYGMDEKKGKVPKQTRFQRKVLEAGAKWQLEVSFRNQQGIPDEVLAIHADFAIRALCTFGGIGSKSRKGFGSLDCGNPLDLNDNSLDSLVEQALRPFSFELENEDDRPYTMNTALMGTIELPFRDPWVVLDAIGEGMRKAATDYRHRPEKGAMGLPRKIHGPLEDELLRHQTWKTHKNPVVLLSEGSKREAKRFASPLFLHLSPGKHGGLVIRGTGFPSDYVRDIQVSQTVLEHYLAKIRQVLDALSPNPGQ